MKTRVCAPLCMFALVVSFCLASPSIAQQQKPDDAWAPFQALIGSWNGKSEGKPGSGEVKLDIQKVLRGRYLQISLHSVYPPQEKNPKGETHEDIGMISMDKARKVYVYRQFNSEGFVNQYTMDAAAADGKTFVFISESIENIPPGWRARETYRILGRDEFEAQFDLAEPGKDFELYSRARYRRDGR